MRLAKIKLGGFKSFVDPTTIPFPSSMSAVVGPNGCGKSNVIDAARWVMGESSAKHLRGGSMEDVIFNGSTSRKPVGRAFVELIFDNSDGTLGGEYANYNEIAIKRVVTRDGQSQYSLNGTRCRRKDITDLFLGTGLGPRSYAIIEQGMITRFIDARPEDMRVYIEEAAGISKYKERRKETESRMRHTQDNLERLEDVRAEVGRQLEHLQRQAEAAERYQALAAERETARTNLQALRLRDLNTQAQASDAERQQEEAALAARQTELKELEATLEQARERLHEANEALASAQARYYEHASEIKRLDQAIAHAQTLYERQTRELAEAEASLTQAQTDLDQEQAHLQELAGEQARLEPEQELAEAAQASAEEALATAAQAEQRAQQRWENLAEQLTEPKRRVQVERTRAEHAQAQLTRAREQAAKLQSERQALDIAGLAARVAELQSEVATARAATQEREAELAATGTALDAARAAVREQQSALAAKRSELQQCQGRLASLEALQQAALGKDAAGLGEWLASRGLEAAPRLGELLTTEAGWERAVETVLGEALQAVCVDCLDAHTEGLDTLGDDPLVLFEIGAPMATAGEPGQLTQKLAGPSPLAGLLAGIMTVTDLPQALAMRAKLQPGQSVITPDGLWLGPDWLRVGRAGQTGVGLLAREQSLRATRAEADRLEAEHARLSEALAAAETEQARLETERDSRQEAVNAAHRAQSTSAAELSKQQAEHERQTQRQQQLDTAIAEQEREAEQHEAALEEAETQIARAEAEVAELTAQTERLQSERSELRAQAETARQQVQQRQQAVHELAKTLTGVSRQRDTVAQTITRLQTQLEQAQTRRQSLADALAEQDTPIADLEAERAVWAERQAQAEQAVNAAKAEVQSIEHQTREREQARAQRERELERTRERVDQLRMAWQEADVRRRTLIEELAAEAVELDPVLERLPADAQAADWQTTLDALEQRIKRLGNVNLAAIDEYRELSERKAYLDSQYDDLTGALETLEQAIRKIDRETRNRFQTTFNAINQRLGQTFPRLFGGGESYLEMTGDDILTTGIVVMARPPGKRLASIQLMSGGEKALTAVAVVFAIFELNPAPFCMLDEVDAPLDEANVGRFGELVRDMSQRVQFIMITHNKTSMELADHLIGITMREPGVSRPVTVDIEAAAQMATG